MISAALPVKKTVEAPRARARFGTYHFGGWSHTKKVLCKTLCAYINHDMKNLTFLCRFEAL